MTDKMLPQAGAGATPEASVLVRDACDWRDTDKKAIANKDDPKAQRAEYYARNKLRQAVDVFQQKRGGRP